MNFKFNLIKFFQFGKKQFLFFGGATIVDERNAGLDDRPDQELGLLAAVLRVVTDPTCWNKVDPLMNTTNGGRWLSFEKLVKNTKNTKNMALAPKSYFLLPQVSQLQKINNNIKGTV